MSAFHIGLERIIYDHAGDAVGVGFTIYDTNAPILGMVFNCVEDAKKGAELVRQLLDIAASITPMRY